jgi:hypothetical protein
MSVPPWPRIMIYDKESRLLSLLWLNNRYRRNHHTQNQNIPTFSIQPNKCAKAYVVQTPVQGHAPICPVEVIEYRCGSFSLSAISSLKAGGYTAKTRSSRHRFPGSSHCCISRWKSLIVILLLPLKISLCNTQASYNLHPRFNHNVQCSKYQRHHYRLRLLIPAPFSSFVKAIPILLRAKSIYLFKMWLPPL